MTRGSAECEFSYSLDQTMRLWLTLGKVAFFQSEAQRRHISAELVSDRRWKRRDIKSTWLLAQVLAKQHASTSGADEAIMHEDAVLARMARCVRIRSVHPYCLALTDTFFWISRAHSIPVSERPTSIDELDALSKTVRYRRRSRGPPWRQAGWRWAARLDGQAAASILHRARMQFSRPASTSERHLRERLEALGGGTLRMPLPADRGKASACQNSLLPTYARSSFSRSSTS